MTIKNRFCFVISVIAAVAFLYLVGDRLIFLARAERTVGRVTNLSSHNDRCGTKRNRYACTKYSAAVIFRAGEGEEEYSTTVSAGTARGHNVPVTSANYRIDSPVEVVFNPRNPVQAYRDTFWDVWSAPIVTLLLQIGTLFGSFHEGRTRDA